MNSMYENMKIQDFFPFDSAIVGMENLYSEVGENSFYAQSGSIISKDKILTRGKKYLVFDIPTKAGITISEVILIDTFYFESCIHLIVENIETQRISFISFPAECPENNCTKCLVDINYFIDRINERAIMQYCGCAKKSKKAKNEGKAKLTDDIFEFDF